MTESRSGAKIIVQVRPNAAKNEVVGLKGEVLQVKVSAPPVKGKANEELVVFLSKVLGVSRSRIAIIKGHTTRSKLIAIDGMTFEDIMKRLLPG